MTANDVLSRKITKDTEIGGKFIGKGSIVMLPLYELFEDPNVYHNPQRFNAERDPRPKDIFGRGKVNPSFYTLFLRKTYNQDAQCASGKPSLW